MSSTFASGFFFYSCKWLAFKYTIMKIQINAKFDILSLWVSFYYNGSGKIKAWITKKFYEGLVINLKNRT